MVSLLGICVRLDVNVRLFHAARVGCVALLSAEYFIKQASEGSSTMYVSTISIGSVWTGVPQNNLH